MPGGHAGANACADAGAYTHANYIDIDVHVLNVVDINDVNDVNDDSADDTGANAGWLWRVSDQRHNRVVRVDRHHGRRLFWKLVLRHAHSIDVWPV